MTSGQRLTLSKQHEEILQLRKRIAELEDQNRWIPVEERIPEINIDVLTCDMFINYKYLVVGRERIFSFRSK